MCVCVGKCNVYLGLFLFVCNEAQSLSMKTSPRPNTKFFRSRRDRRETLTTASDPVTGPGVKVKQGEDIPPGVRLQEKFIPGGG